MEDVDDKVREAAISSIAAAVEMSEKLEKIKRRKTVKRRLNDAHHLDLMHRVEGCVSAALFTDDDTMREELLLEAILYLRKTREHV